MEQSYSAGEVAVRSGGDGPPPGGIADEPSWRPPKSCIDRSGEEAALAHIRGGRRESALKVLMTAYGGPLIAFAIRVLRDPEPAEDIRQQVFLEAFQGFDRFQGRSSLWSWLCGIAYHRCLDELKRSRRARLMISSRDADLLDTLVGEPDAMMDDDRVAKRRALERCLGKLSASIRAQFMMRYSFDLSYQEIGEVVDAPHGTVQVRMSRILPRMRRCLRDEGMAR